MSSLENYQLFQKGIYFLKSDIDLPTSTNVLSKNQVNNIFLNFLGKKPSSIKILPNSTLHKLFQIKANNNSYLLKINLLSKLFHEWYFYCEKLISPVKIYKIDLSRTVVPFDYEITEYIQGKNLYETFRQKGIIKYTHRLGNELAMVHKRKTFGFGPFNVKAAIKKNKLIGIYPNWSDYFFLNLNKHINYLKRVKVINLEDCIKILNIFNKFRSEIVYNSPHLLHGDVANQNAIFASGKIRLIDWEDALSGDPLYDVAFYLTGIYENEKLKRSFLDGYNEIRCISIDNIRYWLYFLRISLVKAIIRYRSAPTKEVRVDYINRIAFAQEKINKWKE